MDGAELRFVVPPHGAPRLAGRVIGARERAALGAAEAELRSARECAQALVHDAEQRAHRLLEEAEAQAAAAAERHLERARLQVQVERARALDSLALDALRCVITCLQGAAEGDSAPALAAVLLQRLQRDLRQRTDVRFLLHPETLQALRDALQQGRLTLPLTLQDLEADAELPPGACVAITPEGTMELRLDDLLSTLFDAIGRAGR